ncbi:DUF6167 family protein [Nocardioides cavernaquae]|uniref:Secreted protein n=1 Tax=Nocardioides cavernaquae TaxID=2321396 RepID=A0A3A5H9S5_9ACTN|nr:DUF6167 family protein [Nocardioides cavernaquae]RJS47376.1 hypothetical protein D4739_14895 [Nocardioides cavernaquae]
MSRALWFVAGAGAGVYGMVKARRAQQALTPDGLRDRAGSLALGARMLRDEVAQAKAEKELELRERLGLPQLASAAKPAPQLARSADHPLAISTDSPSTDSRGTS